MAKAKQPLGPLQSEWLRCLESGEWKQGKSRLCVEAGNEVRYCCLGVACEVAAANGVKVMQEKQDNCIWLFDGHSSALPEQVVKALKFRSDWGKLARPINTNHAAAGALSQANDRGATFKQIARFVRKHPEAVFTEPA